MGIERPARLNALRDEPIVRCETTPGDLRRNDLVRILGQAKMAPVTVYGIYHKQSYGTLAVQTPKIFRIAVEVANLDEAVTFYAKLLGIDGKRHPGARQYFDCGGVILAVLDVSKGGITPTIGPKSIYFAVDEAYDSFYTPHGSKFPTLGTTGHLYLKYYDGTTTTTIDDVAWGGTGQPSATQGKSFARIYNGTAFTDSGTSSDWVSNQTPTPRGFLSPTITP
jgi:hypothetical protein